MGHPPEPHVPRVLVVEDDDDLRCAMSSCLARAGMEVTLVSTGADAVRAARARRPDAIVIDVMLPDSGGLGVANAIRRHPGLGSVPVLFTTAMDSPAMRSALAPAPVLLKPFRRRELVGWVSRAVRIAAGEAVAAPATAP